MAAPLQYSVRGKQDGEVLVFIHGWPATPEIFEAQASIQLSASFHRVLIPSSLMSLTGCAAGIAVQVCAGDAAQLQRNGCGQMGLSS
jgi:hypothetical protein